MQKILLVLIEYMMIHLWPAQSKLFLINKTKNKNTCPLPVRLLIPYFLQALVNPTKHKQCNISCLQIGPIIILCLQNFNHKIKTSILWRPKELCCCNFANMLQCQSIRCLKDILVNYETTLATLLKMTTTDLPNSQYILNWDVPILSSLTWPSELKIHFVLFFSSPIYTARTYFFQHTHRTCIQQILPKLFSC